MNNYRITALLYFLWAMILFSGQALAIDFEIYSTSDTAFLPYRFNTIFNAQDCPNTVKINHPIQILNNQSHSGQIRKILSIANTTLDSDNPAIVSMKKYPGFEVIDDDPIKLNIHDCGLCFDKTTNRKTLFGVGYKSDTAYYFKLDPETDAFEKIYLDSGSDGTGDGVWVPDIFIATIEDYDYDGRDEAIVFLTSMREVGPRRLYSIEPETMTIEWQLDLASQVGHGNLFNLKDSLNPGLIFMTGNPMQGRSDENYNDRFSFVSIVNQHGQLD